MKEKVGGQWNKIFMEIFRSMLHGFFASFSGVLDWIVLILVWFERSLHSAQVSWQSCPWPLKLMTSQRVERTWICTGGYGRFRGEWVNIPEAWKRHLFLVEPPHIGHFSKYPQIPMLLIVSKGIFIIRSISNRNVFSSFYPSRVWDTVGFVLFLTGVKSRGEILYENNDKKTLLSSFVLN